MLIEEALLLAGMIGGVGWILASLRRRAARREEAARLLEGVLATGSYDRLRDYLLVHGDALAPRKRAQVEARCDELYLEKNP